MSEENFVIRKSSHSAGLFSNKPPSLPHLDIELTERCNNACVHCYINLPENDVLAKRRELTTEQWKDILQQAAELGVLSVRFTGGEPLLREDFTELYLFARRLGMKVVLFTNARLITPELANLFARIPPLKKIEITIYGMKADIYDAVSGTPGAAIEFRKGLDLLIDSQVPFLVKSVLLPPNKDELDKYETWVKTLPGDLKPSFTTLLDFRGRRDSPLKNRLIKNLRITPKDHVKIISRFEDDYIKCMAEFSNKFLYPQGDELFNCGAGSAGCVDAYGQYQMCMDLRDPDLVVDLKQTSLRAGLLNKFPLFRQVKATNPEYLQRCARCFLKGLCEQCPAKSWMEHGTLDTPVAYLCQVAHAQAQLLGLLESGEHSWEVDDWQARIHRFVEREQQRSELSTPGNFVNTGDS